MPLLCLNNHMHRLCLADDFCCDCKPAWQTVSHVLMECPLLCTQWQHMTNAIEIVYVRDCTGMGKTASPKHPSGPTSLSCCSQNRTLKLSGCNRLHDLDMHHEYVYKTFLNYLWYVNNTLYYFFFTRTGILTLWYLLLWTSVHCITIEKIY